MATAIVTGDRFRVVVYTYLPAQQQAGINVHFLKAFSTVASPTVENQINILSTYLASLYAPLMAAPANFNGITVQKWQGSGPPPEPIQSSNVPVPGSGGARADNPATCGIITWRTGFAGRKYRGRTYVPFVSNTSQDTDGSPSPAYVINLSSLATGLATPFPTSDGTNGVVWQKYIVHGKLPTSPDDLVTTAFPRKKWANQLRRGEYGRMNTTSPF